MFSKESIWTGIISVIKQLGISPEEVVTIGSGINDFVMLEGAGMGIAMGNAPECVKAKADFVTEDNDHDGVILASNNIFNLQYQYIT